MDRASGSGVFARDPDALLDLIELELNEDILKQKENKAVCDACVSVLNEKYEDWEDEVSQDALCSSSQMLAYCRKKLPKNAMADLEAAVERARKKVKEMSAWRIEGTLREFPKFPSVNLWFDYPTHRMDLSGALGDIQPEAEKPLWQKASDQRKRQAEKERTKKLNTFEIEFCNLEMDGGEVSAQKLAEKLEISSKEMLSWLGTGKKKKDELRKGFEKYMGEDRVMYIRRKQNDSAHD